jgi:D-aspartate ligase
MVRGIDSSVPVVVLGGHHGVLGVARSLGRLGIPVDVVHHNGRTPVLESRYVRRVVEGDVEGMPGPDAVGLLERVAHEIGGRPVLLPTTDATALFVAEHTAALTPLFRFSRRSADLVRSFSDKQRVHELARGLGIPTPAAVFPRSVDDVHAFATRARFPVMLKGIDGTRLEARTDRKMVLVHSERELLAQYARFEDPASPNLMLQEYIPGDDDTVWMFNGYFNDDSVCLAGFTGRKLRQYPVHIGATSLGVCLPNETVRRLTTTFMAAVGYRGILDIGYRYDARDGLYKLLDPNPRIGSTFRLFVAENGLDVARSMYLDLTGQPQPPLPVVPRWGRKWIVEDQDVESCLDYRREGSLTFRQWFSSLRGVEEAAWFAADDVGPFLLMCWELGRRIVRWGTGRLWERIRTAIREWPARWWSRAIHLARGAPG